MEAKFEIIKSYIRQLGISAGRSGRLPTIRSLAVQFHVSTSTVMHALQELEHEKIIVRHQGAGISFLRAGDGELAMQTSSQEAPEVAVAVPDFPNESIWRYHSGMESRLRKRGFQPIPFHLSADVNPVEFLERLRVRKRYFGVLFQNFGNHFSRFFFDKVAEMPFRVVLSNHLYSDYQNLPDNCMVLGPDCESAITEAAECFIRHGHTRIGFVGNEPNMPYYLLQVPRLKQVCQNHGIIFSDKWVFIRDTRIWDNSLNTAQYIVEMSLPIIRDKKITALYVVSTYGALVTISTLRKNGIRVPEDISIISEGNFEFNRWTVPALTTVSADYNAMMDASIDFLEGKTMPGQSRIRLFPQHLVERESVANLADAHPIPLGPDPI